MMRKERLSLVIVELYIPLMLALSFSRKHRGVEAMFGEYPNDRTWRLHSGMVEAMVQTSTGQRA